jgi:SAM-dependent methyltransferase
MDKLVEQQRKHFNKISEKYFQDRKHPNHLLLKDLIWERFLKVYQSNGDLFDFIILIGGLHHVYSRTQDVLNSLKKSLRPGGYFLSFEPTHNNWLTRRIRRRIYKTNDLFDDNTEQGFEYRDLDRYFKIAGYNKVDEVYPGLLAYILYYNPDAFPALNCGEKFLVRSLFAIDRLFWNNCFGRKLSFATMSLWRQG